jgi:hypothetical protein
MAVPLKTMLETKLEFGARENARRAESVVSDELICPSDNRRNGGTPPSAPRNEMLQRGRRYRRSRFASWREVDLQRNE